MFLAPIFFGGEGPHQRLTQQPAEADEREDDGFPKFWT